jgi:hypothetical protein
MKYVPGFISHLAATSERCIFIRSVVAPWNSERHAGNAVCLVCSSSQFTRVTTVCRLATCLHSAQYSTTEVVCQCKRTGHMRTTHSSESADATATDHYRSPQICILLAANHHEIRVRSGTPELGSFSLPGTPNFTSCSACVKRLRVILEATKR